MPEAGETPDVFRFGPFELLVETGELRKNGVRLNVSGQPIKVLTLLVETPGKLVSREELKRRLWGDDTFTDFEKGLNAAVNRLREYLGDSATDPTYVETVPGRGYRFIAPLDPLRDPSPSPAWRAWIKSALSWSRRALELRKRWVVAGALTALVLVVASVAGLPSIARYYNNRGVELQRSGDLKGAIGDYQRAISLRPGYAEAHYNLADAYEEVPAYDKAQVEYQKAIEADPTFYEAYNNLARLYIKRQKDYPAALELLERGISLNPPEPSVQYSLHKNQGWANYELQLAGKAEISLRRAIEIDQFRGAAHCLLAKVLDMEGNESGALNEWTVCVTYSGQPDVEPEWRAEGEERLHKEAPK